MTAEFNRTYTYDDFHSLVRAGAASGNNAQGFQYDAVGRLIAVRRGTAGWPVEEELAYDGTQMVAAWNGAGVATWSALWGQGVDNLISVKPGVDGAEVMALKDGRGSVVGYYQAEATPQGLLATADYTPEGRVTSKDWVTGTTCTETGSTQCPRLGGLPFGFHGAYKSPAHGLLYFRNRWYSAEAGQWLTQDPLGEVDSVNLYAFNRFDSVNFIDPFGLESQGAAPGHSPNGRDPKDPKLDGGAELDISVRAGGVDDAFIADMECKYLGKCATGNLERLEQKGSWRQPSDVPPESPTSVVSREPGGRSASRAPLLYVGILDMLVAQLPPTRLPTLNVRFQGMGEHVASRSERVSRDIRAELNARNAFIGKVVEFIGRTPGPQDDPGKWNRVSLALKAKLNDGTLRAGYSFGNYGMTLPGGSIVIGDFGYAGGQVTSTLVHEYMHSIQSVSDFVGDPDDPDKEFGQAYEFQHQYEQDLYRAPAKLMQEGQQLFREAKAFEN